MKYICVGYYSKAMDSHPRTEIDAVLKECPPYLEDLYQTGQVIFDVGLKAETFSVRTVKGKLSVTDGPFVETKEQIGGVFIIEAKDREEAVQLAARHPAARLGEQFGFGLQIHPIHYFKQ